jgi:hypothetical protein
VGGRNRMLVARMGDMFLVSGKIMRVEVDKKVV